MSTVTAIVCLAANLFSCQSADIRVVDGDTIRLGRETIRFERINAPEIGKPACDAEKRLGRVAKERVAELVGSGMITVERNGRDRYKRTLATIRVDGRDIGGILMSEGLARKWEKKWRPGLDGWCL